MGFEDDFRAVALTLLRLSAFTSHAILFGLIPVLILVLRPSFKGLESSEWIAGRQRFAARLEGIVRACLWASFASTVLILLVQAALISEFDGGKVTDDSVLSVLETTFGQWLGLRIPLVAALAVLLVGRVKHWVLSGVEGGDGVRAPRSWWVAWGLLATALLATSSLSGHATVATPRGWSIANDVLHLISGGTWFTGIVILAVALPDGWVGKRDVDKLMLLSPAVNRFSKVALVSITIVTITGTLNSFLHVGRFGDLWSTGYGRTLGVKIIFFLGILGLGALNHFFLRHKLERALQEGAAGRAPRHDFRRSIAIELVVALT
ncbi:MAG: copper resistance D family protein, partial [Actinomycetota bacterium]